MNKEQPDFVAIGEMAVDAFIRLTEATVTEDAEGNNRKLCLDFGAKIPYESVTEVAAVANAGNAAVSASRLGLHSALVANAGEDPNGQKCLASLKTDGVITDYVRLHADKQTNYHYILWFKEDRTILQKHSDFDYTLGNIGSPKWIYLTSLGEKSLPFHHTISDYLKAHSEIKMAFQPGIFQIKFGAEQLKKTYAETDIFCCNVEEAQTILNEQSRDVKTLLVKISELGPKTVLITDGMAGAYAYETTSPEDFWFMPIYPHTPYERTGAGDAFFSTVVSALCMGKTLAEALTWGPINSMSVVQQIGAQKGLLSLEKLQEFLTKAPAEYVLKKI